MLVWNSLPASSNASADLVLGQGSLTSCAGNDSLRNGTTGLRSAATLFDPTDVWSDGTRVIVADRGNNRLLVWSSFPTANGAAADVVIGQGNFTRAAANDDAQIGTAGSAPTARTLAYPSGVALVGTALVVSDTLNHRVLVLRPR